MGLHGSRAVGAFVSLCSMFSATPAAAETAPIWNGAYAGVHGGVTWAEVDAKYYGSVKSIDPAWGLHAGYNVGKGRIVVGVEVDANFSNAEFDATTSSPRLAGEIDWSGSVRARFGITMGPALFYGTLGYAWTVADLNEWSPSGAHVRSTETFTGIVYGLGAEGFVLPNISLRIEALQFDYSAQDISARTVAAMTSLDPNETVVRVGATFHFN